MNIEFHPNRLLNILEKVCKAGADYSDVYIERGRGHSVYFEGGVIEEIGSSISGGSGIRIIGGENSAYVHSPVYTEKEIVECINEASKNLGIPFDYSDSGILRETEILPEQRSLPSPDINFMHKIDTFLRHSSDLLTQVTIRHDLSAKNILILKSSGEYTEESRFYSTFLVQVIVEKNGVIQTASESQASSTCSDKFWEMCDPFKLSKQALDRALLMLDAPECPAGNMKVVLSGEAGGTMIHEACGHGLEADIMQKDFSVYRNKTGQKVASPLVTLVDNSRMENMYGSYIYDDEGNPSRENILIENGILKSQLTDYMSAKRGGLPLSGNARRSSYRNMPIPRMSNTYLLAGESKPDKIINEVDKGLFVKKMGGGEVNPTSGDFVFKVTEGYLIENGKITSPVKGALLIGNGPQILMDIVAVGDDLTFMPGVCGKSGQNVPVSDGQPTVLINRITVGGKELNNAAI